MRKLLLLILSLAGLASCVYPYNVDLEDHSDNIIVFDGKIYVGGTSTISISRVLTFEEGYYVERGTSEGTAWIEDDSGKEYYSPVTWKRSVINIPTEDASPDRKYRFVAKVDDQTYVSDWIDVVPPPVIDTVSIGLVPRDSSTVQVAVTVRGGDAATGYIGLSFDETWEFHSEWECRYELDTIRWRENERTSQYPNYWCWKSASSYGMLLIDYSEFTENSVIDFPIHHFPRSSNRNHKKYSINVKAVTLPAATYKYLKNLNDISNGNGSLFSPNPGEIPSNIRCDSDPSRRVLGYVTASLETHKRVFMDSQFYSYPLPNTSYLFIPEDKKESYENGSYPVLWTVLPKGDEGQDVEGIYWGPLRCIDCVVDGGTKEKPDFWE